MVEEWVNDGKRREGTGDGGANETGGENQGPQSGEKELKEGGAMEKVGLAENLTECLDIREAAVYLQKGNGPEREVWRTGDYEPGKLIEKNIRLVGSVSIG